MRVARGKFQIRVARFRHLPPLEHFAKNLSSSLFVPQKNALPLCHLRSQIHHRAISKDDRCLGRFREYLALFRSVDVLRPLYRHRDFQHGRLIAPDGISHVFSHH
jgi:hypothetical protein